MHQKFFKILILNNGFSTVHVPFIIDSFNKNENFEVKIVHNHLGKSLNLLQKIFYKLRYPIDLNSFNRRSIRVFEIFKPNIVLIIKGNDIYPSVLKKIKSLDPNTKLVSWTGDNMLKKHNSSYYFIKGISLYDIHFTTKSNAVKGLMLKGVKKVKFLNKAFNKDVHFPSVNKKLFFEVLFIGSYEKPRYETMRYLADNGIEINIYGNGWEKIKSQNNLIIHHKPLQGENYREAISTSKINLCFLRKANDDLQTDRTMEIPACKGFMIAERTDEHLNLFKEDSEAVFFNSDNELLKKIKYYLKNDDLRNKIAENGYSRAIKSNYSYDNMIEKIIKSCFENE
jgi:spore maturation protein CgeB